MFLTAFSTPTTVGMPFSKPTIALGDVIPFSSVIKPNAFLHKVQTFHRLSL